MMVGKCFTSFFPLVAVWGVKSSIPSRFPMKISLVNDRCSLCETFCNSSDRLSVLIVVYSVFCWCIQAKVILIYIAFFFLITKPTLIKACVAFGNLDTNNTSKLHRGNTMPQWMHGPFLCWHSLDESLTYKQPTPSRSSHTQDPGFHIRLHADCRQGRRKENKHRLLL